MSRQLALCLLSLGLLACQSVDPRNATPASTASPAQWNLSTGAYAPDEADTSTWLPLSIALDTLTVSSSSARLTTTATSSTVTTVSLDGNAVITLTRDDYGLTIRSTLAADTHIAYQLQGSGSTPITLYSDNDYQLLLSNASIASPDGPALNLQSKSTAFVQLSGASSLSDSATWTARTTDDGDRMDLKSTFFAEGPLVVDGDGSLQINARSKHALASDAHLRLKNGRLSLRPAAKDGLRANHAFVMDGGSLDIEAPAGKGIKVEGKEDSVQPLGFIAINAGSLRVRSHDKAVTASWEAEDGKTRTRRDDPDPRVTINGGSLDLQTSGRPHEDFDTSNGNDTLAPEGIEAKSSLSIRGGSISIRSTDDSLNAGKDILISGGRLHAVSTLNDAIDSNGALRISGGYIVAQGAAEPESAMDNDRNTFAITGGVLVGIGGATSMPTAHATTQNTVVVGGPVGPGRWTMRDRLGKAVFSFELPTKAQVMVLSAPSIRNGASYIVVHGGSLTQAAEHFQGLAIEPGIHHGGHPVARLHISQSVSTLGQIRRRGPPPGWFPSPGYPGPQGPHGPHDPPPDAALPPPLHPGLMPAIPPAP